MKMNYTNPNDEKCEDTPEDWLNSSLIFAKALSNLLNINEGILIDLKGDMLTTLPKKFENETRVFVYKGDDDMIHVSGTSDQDLPGELPDGQMITFGE
jgi:hypothetical protein